MPNTPYCQHSKKSPKRRQRPVNAVVESQTEHVAIEDPVVTISHLRAELANAHERARVAEEQLQRVYVAVRSYKKRHIAARQRADAQANSVANKDVKSQGWPTIDPTLDERFEEYIDSEFEPDRSRTWILGSN